MSNWIIGRIFCRMTCRTGGTGMTGRIGRTGWMTGKYGRTTDKITGQTTIWMSGETVRTIGWINDGMAYRTGGTGKTVTHTLLHQHTHSIVLL